MDIIQRTKFIITVLGDSYIGKTCLIETLNGIPFNENQVSTIGIDFFIQSVIFDGIKYNFKMYDTAGQFRFSGSLDSTIKHSSAFVLLFSVDNKDSFKAINKYIKEIKKNVDINEKVIILVGNKNDIEKREVSKEEGMNLAKELNIKYFETSAKINYGVKEAFEELYKDIYQLKIQPEKDKKNEENKTKNKESKSFEKKKCLIF